MTTAVALLAIFLCHTAYSDTNENDYTQLQNVVWTLLYWPYK